MTCHILIKKFSHFLSESKNLKCLSFTLISLKSDYLCNFILKANYSMSYNQTLLFWKNIYLVDSRSRSVSLNFTSTHLNDNKIV